MSEHLTNVTLAANAMAREIERLKAENDRLRAELATAVPQARERALKEAAGWVWEHVPDDVYAQIWDAAQAAQAEVNQTADVQEAAS